MEFIPKFIKQTIAKRNKEVITAEEWNSILNLLIQQGDHNSEFLKQIADNNSTTEEVIQMINEAVFNTGAADMTKVIYDTNNNGVVDVAETVLENSIKTESIQENAITQSKLSEALNSKLNYLYSSVSKILIRLGAQSEIEGSEDLILFGLDGNLEVPYNAFTENLKILLSDTTLPAETATLNHWELNLSEQVKENKYYTLTNTDNTEMHESMLTNIVNAQASYSQTIQSVGSVSGSKQSYTEGLEHLEGNLYVANTEDGGGNYSFIVLEHNPETNTFTVVNTKTIGGNDTYDWDSQLHKMGKYVFGRKSRDNSSGTRNYNTVLKITKDGITELGQFNNWDPSILVGREGGYCYYVENEDDSSAGVSSAVTVLFNGSTIYTCSSNYHRVYNFKQISGKYGYFYIKHWKDDTLIGDYIVNLITGNLTKLTTTQAEQFKNVAFYPDADGYHTYFGNGKYILEDDFTFTLIEEYPYEITNGDIDHGYYIFENTLYKLTPSEKKAIYNINNGPIEAGTVTYSQSFSAVNPNNLSTATLYKASVKGFSPGITAATFNPGTVDLVTPLLNKMITPCYITRKQECNIAPGAIKQIHLKPETKDNTYTRLEIILNLDRALTENETIKVEYVSVIEGVVTKAEMNPIESNVVTTKYFDWTFETPVSDIDVLITINNKSDTALQVTQVLGGVDNEV